MQVLINVMTFAFKGWLNTRPQLERDVLFPLFESVFDELRTFVIQNCVPKMEVRYYCVKMENAK